MEWDIKIKGCQDNGRARQIYADLEAVQSSILELAPNNVDSAKLKRNHIRIYPFSKSEPGNEYFIINGRKGYVCLNANILKRRYWAALQFLIHGLAHSFCYLRDEIGEEAFCEWAAYSVIKKLAEQRGEKFCRRILKSIMSLSSQDYRAFYRAAKHLEARNPGCMIKLNNRAKHRKIRKSIEKQIISRALKTKRHKKLDELDYSIPELEKGFRKI